MKLPVLYPWRNKKKYSKLCAFCAPYSDNVVFTHCAKLILYVRNKISYDNDVRKTNIMAFDLCLIKYHFHFTYLNLNRFRNLSTPSHSTLRN